MNSELNIPKEKKLTILYRIEPGCLGPDGKLEIDEFCLFASTKITDMKLMFVNCTIEPRNDKTLPELQFYLLGKHISYDQAKLYMHKFERDIDVFFEDLDDRLANYIDEFIQKP